MSTGVPNGINVDNLLDQPYTNGESVMRDFGAVKNPRRK